VTCLQGLHQKGAIRQQCVDPYGRKLEWKVRQLLLLPAVVSDAVIYATKTGYGIMQSWCLHTISLVHSLLAHTLTKAYCCAEAIYFP
jgi:hypothetical protein